jgi:hypothetical protein
MEVKGIQPLFSVLHARRALLYLGLFEAGMLLCEDDRKGIRRKSADGTIGPLGYALCPADVCTYPVFSATCRVACQPGVICIILFLRSVMDKWGIARFFVAYRLGVSHFVPAVLSTGA